MGTGISMSSVNKIKELVDSGDFSLALDILEHQDLSKSLSPQFIKICGDVYYENKRYVNARESYLKAHSMAPMGNKIIFSIIKLYLSMGLYSLVDTYFEFYKFNQGEHDPGVLRIEYMIAKAKRKSVKELYSILVSANEVETDEYWDFEMLVLYKYMEDDKFKLESDLYAANYKGSKYIEKIDQMKDDSFDLDEYIYCYPEDELADIEDAHSANRELEKSVLAADELIMHPADPNIILIVDDNEPVTNSMKRKIKRVQKKDQKEARKALKEAEAEGEDSAEGVAAVANKARKFFNRIAKKEEEAMEDALLETEGETIDKAKLLDEVLSENPEITYTVDENAELTAEDVAEELNETVPEVISDNLDEISEATFDESMDDFEFAEQDDFDTVIMVEIEEEAPENEEVEIVAPEPEEPEEEQSESQEVVEDNQEAPEQVDFDIDSAMDSLEGFQVEEEDIQAVEYKPESTTSYVINEDEFVDDVKVEVQPEPEAPEVEDDFDVDGFDEAEGFEEDVIEVELDDLIPDEAVEEIIEEVEEDTFEEEVVEVEETTTIPEYVEVSEEILEDTVEDTYVVEEEVPAEETSPEEEEVPVAETSPVEAEPEPAPTFTYTAPKKSVDFPVFKSELFPEYNNEDLTKTEEPEETFDARKEFEEKMSESLAKEQKLLDDTDALLRSLGINI